MDSARSWLQKFQPRDRLRSTTRKKDSMASCGKEDPKPLTAEEASNITKQKVAAAKQYIENHYKSQMKNLQERRERYAISLCFLFLSSSLKLNFGCPWTLFSFFFFFLNGVVIGMIIRLSFKSITSCQNKMK